MANDNLHQRLLRSDEGHADDDNDDTADRSLFYYSLIVVHSLRQHFTPSNWVCAASVQSKHFASDGWDDEWATLLSDCHLNGYCHHG